MKPLCFDSAKFFAQVATAEMYMQLVPKPTPTKAKTMMLKGHPSPSDTASGGGPDLNVNAARRYPAPNRIDDTSERGGGE